MAKTNRAVFDTGPIIHLQEINLLKALKIFKEIIIPPEVYEEINKKPAIKSRDLSRLKVINLKSRYKDMSKLLAEKYELDLGEAEAISLALQEKTDLLFTDDLDARTIAKEFNLEVHGTIGIIIRAFKEKSISKEITIEKIKELYTNSSLFITKDIVEWVIQKINDYKS